MAYDIDDINDYSPAETGVQHSKPSSSLQQEHVMSQILDSTNDCLPTETVQQSGAAVIDVKA